MEFGILFTSHPNHATEPYPHREVHARVTAEIEAADALGYDTAWVAEHHFSNQYGIMPDVFTYLGYLAARTSRIRLGTAVVTVPLYDPIRVVENLAFHAAIWGHDQRFEQVLEELKLGQAAHMRARYLSAGQRRRVALAMLKLQGAKLWLLDEPTTNLDGEGRALVVEWTRRHVMAGGLAVIATHQPDEFAMRGALMIDLT